MFWFPVRWALQHHSIPFHSIFSALSFVVKKPLMHWEQRFRKDTCVFQTHTQPVTDSPSAIHTGAHTSAHVPACSQTRHRRRGTTHTYIRGEKKGPIRRFKDTCQMHFKIHQTPSSGAACMILWTKCHFGSQHCWASDPDGLCIHLLKSYFTVLKLTCSSVISRDISSFLLVGSLAPGHQQGLGWECSPHCPPLACLFSGEQGLIQCPWSRTAGGYPFPGDINSISCFLMIPNFSVPIFKKIKEL